MLRAQSNRHAQESKELNRRIDVLAAGHAELQATVASMKMLLLGGTLLQGNKPQHVDQAGSTTATTTAKSEEKKREPNPIFEVRALSYFDRRTD